MSRIESGLTILLVLGLLLVLLLLKLLPAGGPGGHGSVFSTDGHGHRALYLVLDRLGLDVRAWTDAPGTLPRGSALLHLGAVPEPPPGHAVAEPTEPGARPLRSRRQRDPRHYLRFVEEGGVLLVSAETDMLRFLRTDLDLAPLEELMLLAPPLREEDPVAATLPTAERVELGWRPESFFDAPPVASELEVVAADDEGRPLVISLPVGRGAVALLAPGKGLFENDELGAAGGALLFVRLAEYLAPGAPILFDEYALGGWVPDSPVGLALSSAAIGLTLHLTALGLLALWAVARTREYPRDPEPLAQVSALSRARGFAGLLTGAGRWDLLAQMLRAGVLRRLAAGAGLGRAAPTGDPILAEVPPERVRALAARLAPSERARIQELFFRGGVENEVALQVLGERLAELELRMGSRATVRGVAVRG